MPRVQLKPAAVPVKRDVIFLATADEEVGGGVGAGWFVEHHPDLIRDAEFLLNEGGTIRADASGRIEYYGVGTTEKSPFWLDVTARGTAGHRARPPPGKPPHPPGGAPEPTPAGHNPPHLRPAAGRHAPH